MSRPRIEFVGQEVVCRTFGRYVTEWQKNGYSLEALVEGSGCTVEHLRNKQVFNRFGSRR